MSSQMEKHYQETIQYLYNLQFFGIKLGLHNIGKLLEYWENPQNKWPAIHIAGTNGKGSTAAFLYAILRELNIKVGLYTSPHLIDFSERIRVDDKSISWKEVVKYTTKMRPVMEKINPTFFEATSAIAFRYFADQGVDIAVIETGLGGRLDATNLVNSIATVITPIHFDHQKYLGYSLQKIAREKAGIIKSQIPCFTNNGGNVLNIIKKTCYKVKAPLYVIDSRQLVLKIEERFDKSIIHLKLPQYEIKNLTIPLAGIHQVKNAVLAVFTLLHLPGLGVQKNHIKTGCNKIYWPGF
jgi:dihydrofolate synthase/folylpolyglutamate synthase